jgi:2-amino-4-hydroxy-6-hydroxymethyldihydropteridine diphosphokinase
MVQAFVAVGSNIDPARNVEASLRALALRVRITAISTVYLTDAEGRPGQPPFYNGVVGVDTDATPHTLKFEVLRRIEADLGRQRSSDRYAPRTADLDLIIYGQCILNSAEMVLADPQIRHRPFLAWPLAELVPDLVLPGTGMRMAEIAGALPADRMCALRAYTFHLRRTIGIDAQQRPGSAEPDGSRSLQDSKART